MYKFFIASVLGFWVLSFRVKADHETNSGRLARGIIASRLAGKERMKSGTCNEKT
jgi:hypothetical protein